jgi:hypothetical protein
MPAVDRFDLITKLAAVENLEGAGATEGERSAAAHARVRLETRLADTEAPLPNCFAQEMVLGHHLQRPARIAPRRRHDARLPDRREVTQRVEDWRRGETSSRSVARWAAAIVDSVVLPDLPADDPGSIVPEILLVLAAGPPKPRVAVLALRFLEASPGQTAEAWHAWLAGLAAIG